MYYGFTNLATDWKKKDLDDWRVRLLNTLFFFIRANRDNEKLYHKVQKWLIELDDDGQPVREIGVGENNEPLFSAPNNRNYGFWTDNDKKFTKEDISLVGRDVFEEMWSKLN